MQKSNWFIDQLNLYQSANGDFDSIKRNFVIRKTEFARIIDSLSNKHFKDPLQCELVLGRRGSGKSTLLKRIEIEVVENIKLSEKYIPINLAEEQAGIYRLFDLWEQVIEELCSKRSESIKLKQYNQFEHDQEYTRYLYDVIHEDCLSKNRKIVLLLDNFDRIIENFTDDGNLLREILINYNDIAIIAGSTRMDEHFWRYDMPFYEFFRRHRLDALSEEEISNLISHWSETLDLPELKEFEKHNQGKIENIRILTDGLPRTLQFFLQMVLKDTNFTSYEYLKKIMDNVTPLYQERLNHLPAQLRKIVLEMAFVWEACTTKQLVRKCKMESKLISANLKTLIDKGIVDKIETSKKNHLYRISERFFNLWLIVTQGNPEQKRKAKWLSIFIENWYDSNDLKVLVQNHIEKLRGNQYSEKETIVLSKALSQCKYISTKQRDDIIELTSQLSLRNDDNYLVELPETFKETVDVIERHVENGNLEHAIKLAEEIENEADGLKFTILAYIYFQKSDFQNAEKYLQDALNCGNTNVLFSLGEVKVVLEKFEEAEETFLLALKNGNDSASYALGVLNYNLGNFEKSEKSFLLSKKLGDDNSDFNLGIIYYKQGKLELAKEHYYLSLKNGNKEALNSLGEILFLQKNYGKSEEYFLQAIENGNKLATLNLAFSYYSLNIKKGKAFQYTKKHGRDTVLGIIVEIWNGVFENIEQRVISLVNDSIDFFDDFIFNLLVHKQNVLVGKLFDNAEFGTDLKSKFSILYYVYLISNGVEIDNVKLKIPPEIISTINSILEKIEEKQVFYGYRVK